MKHFLRPPRSYSWQKRGKDASCGVCDCRREEAVGSHLSMRRINDLTHLSSALAHNPSLRRRNALWSQFLAEEAWMAAGGSWIHAGLLPHSFNPCLGSSQPLDWVQNELVGRKMSILHGNRNGRKLLLHQKHKLMRSTCLVDLSGLH